MKTITIEIADDEIIVAIKRPEEYEDVCPQLIAEDVTLHSVGFEWRVVEPKEPT